MTPDQILDNFCNQLDPNLALPSKKDGLPYLYCGWFHSAEVWNQNTLVIRIRKDADKKFKLPAFPDIYWGLRVQIEKE